MKPIAATLIVALFTWSSMAMAAQRDDEPQNIVRVWPDEPPAWTAPTESERDLSTPDDGTIAGAPIMRLTNVSAPELHVYPPADSTNAKTVVVICPGGGYSILAWDLEGVEIAQWLNRLGVTAVVLKYRVPTRNENPRWLAPVQDIQRSISLIRSGGVEGLEPEQVGVLGFSAGGNASARAITASKRHYQAVDQHDEASRVPDFGVLIYPAWLVTDEDSSKLVPEIRVTEKTPPVFFAHARDDPITCLGSVTMFSALQQQGVASELHVFASGGHGFGARPSGTPDDQWPDLCENWMRGRGWLSK